MSDQLRYIAQYILWFAGDVGEPLTNLKLQKLVYYAQAWYLTLYNTPLFPEPIEAWVHGPVVKTLYDEYKAYGKGPITPCESPPTFEDENIKSHLDEIIGVFLGYDAFTLQRMTHQEDPWLEARKGLDYDDLSKEEINQNTMKTFYQKLVEA